METVQAIADGLVADIRGAGRRDIVVVGRSIAGLNVLRMAVSGILVPPGA